MKLEDMKGAIILLAFIALLGAAAAISLDSFKSDLESDLTSNNVANESETSLSNSSVVGCNFVNTGTPYYALVNLTGTTEDENWTTVSSTNMTIDSGGGVTIYYPGILNNESKINYDCLVTTVAYNVTGYGLESLNNSTGYLDTIGTIIGVAILIGIIVMAFAFFRR